MKEKLTVVFEEYWPVIRDKMGSIATDISDEDLKKAVLKAHSLTTAMASANCITQEMVGKAMHRKQTEVDR